MSDPPQPFKRRFTGRTAYASDGAADQAVTGGRATARRDMRHGRHRSFLGWFLSVAVALSVVAGTAGDSSGSDALDSLVGQYRHSSVFTAGETRRSVASIARRGSGFSIAWEEDD